MPKIKDIKLIPVENGFKVVYDCYGKLDPSDAFSPEKYLATKEEVFSGENAPYEAITRVIILHNESKGIIKREIKESYDKDSSDTGLDESGMLSNEVKD